jgi:hypothetical protein
MNQLNQSNKMATAHHKKNNISTTDPYGVGLASTQTKNIIFKTTIVALLKGDASYFQWRRQKSGLG